MAPFGKLDLSMLEQPAGPARETVGLDAIAGCGPAADCFPLPAVHDVSGSRQWCLCPPALLLPLVGAAACQPAVPLQLWLEDCCSALTSIDIPSGSPTQPALGIPCRWASSRIVPIAARFCLPSARSWTRLSGRLWSL